MLTCYFCWCRLIHASGIDKKVIPDTVGSRVAFIDYDNDGALDLYLVNIAQPYESPNQSVVSLTPDRLMLYTKMEAEVDSLKLLSKLDLTTTVGKWVMYLLTMMVM